MLFFFFFSLLPLLFLTYSLCGQIVITKFNDGKIASCVDLLFVLFPDEELLYCPYRALKL